MNDFAQLFITRLKAVDLISRSSYLHSLAVSWRCLWCSCGKLFFYVYRCTSEWVFFNSLHIKPLLLLLLSHMSYIYVAVGMLHFVCHLIDLHRLLRYLLPSARVCCGSCFETSAMYNQLHRLTVFKAYFKIYQNINQQHLILKCCTFIGR